MSNRIAPQLLLILLSAWCGSNVLALELAGTRPNIIFVMTDDQGYGDLGCHGNPVVQTPNLDRLHAESIRFTDFHVSPTCAPTRAALMTGRHEFKSGVTHTIFERERLNLSATTIAQVLRSAGYATGIFGKWHLGDERDYQPDRRGFEEVFIHGGGGIGQTYPGSCGDAPGNKYFDPALLHNGRFEKTKGFCTDVFFNEALRWIKVRSSGDNPFFAYICPNAPHGPLVSPGAKFDAIYKGREVDGKPLNSDSIAYYAMITNIDENVGRLLATLDELGITKKTLVIFMTDNGSTHAHLYSAGMRGGKGTPYQGGTRVPCFWRWPDTLASREITQLAAHVDMCPTLVALSGATLPNGPPIDGRSLIPLLQNADAPWPDRYLFTHLGRWERGQADQAKYKNCAVRNARFRFVNNRELYDLRSDPAESKNIIDEHPHIVAAMRTAYEQWWNEVRPLMTNEDALGPKENPFKALYWKQFGGRPKAGFPNGALR